MIIYLNWRKIHIKFFFFVLLNSLIMVEWICFAFGVLFWLISSLCRFWLRSPRDWFAGALWKQKETKNNREKMIIYYYLSMGLIFFVFFWTIACWFYIFGWSRLSRLCFSSPFIYISIKCEWTHFSFSCVYISLLFGEWKERKIKQNNRQSHTPLLL